MVYVTRSFGVHNTTFYSEYKMFSSTFCCMCERITVAVSFHWSPTSSRRKTALAWRTWSLKIDIRINTISVLLTYSKSSYLEIQFLLSTSYCVWSLQVLPLQGKGRRRDLLQSVWKEMLKKYNTHEKPYRAKINHHIYLKF